MVHCILDAIFPCFSYILVLEHAIQSVLFSLLILDRISLLCVHLLSNITLNCLYSSPFFIMLSKHCSMHILARLLYTLLCLCWCNFCYNMGNEISGFICNYYLIIGKQGSIVTIGSPKSIVIVLHFSFILIRWHKNMQHIF